MGEYLHSQDSRPIHSAMTTRNRNRFSEKFVINLGRFIEGLKLHAGILTEAELEQAVIPAIRKSVEAVLPRGPSSRPVLYHHGTTTEEKRQWSDSKPLQIVQLFGTNVSDMFIAHPRMGAVAIEFKFVKGSGGSIKLTSQIQRAIGQAIIATLRHPYAI